MSTNRRKFTPEFKADAVQLVVVGTTPLVPFDLAAYRAAKGLI